MRANVVREQELREELEAAQGAGVAEIDPKDKSKGGKQKATKSVEEI